MNEAKFTRGFVFIMMGLSFLLGLGTMKYWPHNIAQRQAVALAGTNQTQFKPLDGGAAQAAGHTPSQAELDKLVADKLGKAVAEELRKRGGSATSILHTTSSVPASISQLQPLPFTPTSEGMFSGVVKQDRLGLPALTSAHFVYTKDAGLSVSWENKEEVFKESFVISRNRDDSVSGYSRLIRVVDGMEEPIKATGSDFYIPVSEVTHLPIIPKGSFGLGPFLDQHSGKTRPLLFTSRQWNRSTSTAAIYIPNVGYSVIITHTYGRQ